MLQFVRTSWYRRLNDQSVRINNKFKDHHCMILRQNQQYISRKCASINSQTVSWPNMWYKGNTNKVLPMWFKNIYYDIYKISKKSVSVILSFGGGKWAPKRVGWMTCFLLIASGLIRMLRASCVVCNNLLFLHSLNKISPKQRGQRNHINPPGTRLYNQNTTKRQNMCIFHGMYCTPIVFFRAPSQYKDRLIYVWRFPC